MKKHTSIVFKIFLFIASGSIWAQELPNIVPPAPEAAALGKFTEIPISHYTGVPNISIPITSFNVGNKSFPVSINYHARGLQVSETASRVGLGWALNASGQISRQVRHKADDGFTGIFGDTFSTYNDVFNNESNTNLASDLATRFSETSDYDYDKLPDLFTLSAGDLSSKFIFNYEDSKPLAQKYDDIIIEHVMGGGDTVGSGIAGFIVTDKNGYRYYFGIDSSGNAYNPVADVNYTQKKYTFKANGTYSVVDPLQEPVDMADEWAFFPYYNTWHLTEIVSPNGDRAHLIYTKETNYMYRRSGDKYNIEASSNEKLHNYTDLVRVQQWQLSEIRYNYGADGDYTKIVFEGNDLREDMYTSIDTSDDDTSSDAWPSDAKELDAIKLYQQSHTYLDNGEMVTDFTLNKTFNLSHHYMISNDDNGPNSNHLPLLGIMNPSARKRLVLDSITEVGLNGVSKPPYVFTYNSEILPNRHSNSKDYWGYYNGKNNGHFLCGYGNNRRVDTTLSEAGMLKKITYPTAGSTRFTYEHNIGRIGSEYDGISLPDINPDSGGAISLSNIGITNGLFHPGGIYGGYYKTERFTVTSASLFNFNIQLPEWNMVNQMEACVEGSADCEFRIRLVPIDGNNSPDPSESIYIWTNSLPMWIPAGEYQLEVHTPNNWDPYAQADDPNSGFFIAALSWTDQVADEDTVLYAAGKRIKQIEFLDENNTVVSKRTYDYNNSGIILGISDFNYSVTLDYGGEPVEAIYEPYHLFSTYQGNTIGYKFVEEFYGDKNNNYGKRSYNFLVTKDSGDFTARPRTPPTDNEWLRGLPIQIIDYKRNDNGSYSRVKQIDNEYLVANDDYRDVLPLPIQTIDGLENPILTPETVIYNTDNIPTNLPDIFYEETNINVRVPLVHHFVGNSIIDEVEGDSKIKIFHFTGGTLDTSETIETLYDGNQNPTLVTKTKTGFNYDVHYQPDMVTTVTSDGKPVIQTFSYPQELVSDYTIHPETYSPNPITALAEQHRFVPLETHTYKDDNQDGYPGFAAPEELKSKTKTIYAWQSGVLEPSLIQTAKGTNPLENRIRFKKYDADGNILHVSREDGMDICYIYGYDKSLPVAKIENATYSQVAGFVNSIQNASDFDTSSCMSSQACNENTLRNAQNNLRQALPLAMVTTYTYDPLIGVTSMTDPKGYTVYYEYDDLHRLVRVKDQDGKVLSENKYHYLLD
ncbi:RHS repeat domain-containing protein [uncultured Psychroserpens sp.]|uniref:RHS repeat domain-containing protein n=1 Tax=uncultured Psychroserpens sp. TaxID=255436 RepID=UPI00261EA094|nr:RHS repeat domain-containing protein [uncultured Psychroserpens sp.]